MSDSALTLFIPFGQGYGNPGLTLRAETADELAAIIGDLSDAANEEETSKLDKILDGVLLVNAGVSLKGLSVKPEPKASASVTHPQATSSGEAKSCSHGAMKWNEGIGRQSGKPFKGWFCQAPYGQTKCAPEFVK